MVIEKVILTIWVCRNEDGTLVFFKDRPHKGPGKFVNVGKGKGYNTKGVWLGPNNEEGTPLSLLCDNDYPAVKWNNPDPSVMLLTPTVGSGSALK